MLTALLFAQPDHYWGSLDRTGSVDEDRQAQRCSSKLYGEPSAFVCSSTENLIRQGHEIRFASEDPLRTSGHSEPIGLVGTKRLCATFPSRASILRFQLSPGLRSSRKT